MKTDNFYWPILRLSVFLLTLVLTGCTCSENENIDVTEERQINEVGEEKEVEQNEIKTDGICKLQQITNEREGDSFFPSVSSDGTRIALASRANINDGNPDGNLEIYLYDTNTKDFKQVTKRSITPPLGDSSFPSINSEGTFIAFHSDGEGSYGNDIFLYDINGEQFYQITNANVESATPWASWNPSISSNAKRIAFHSYANIVGNNIGNSEIYLYEANNNTISQITKESIENRHSSNPSVSANGQYIAFESQADINGGNPDGNKEIFLYEIGTGELAQITNEPRLEVGYVYKGHSTDPSINADGTRTVFVSEADINGGNPDGNKEIFLYDNETEKIIQITNEKTENGNVLRNSESPSINSDGTRIVFQSSANLNGGNLDSNFEIYFYNIDNNKILQVTNEPRLEEGYIGKGHSLHPSVNSDGTHIVFQSSSNINGGNPEGNTEIFLAVCEKP